MKAYAALKEFFKSEGGLVAFSTVTIAAATALFDKEARLVRLATR